MNSMATRIVSSATVSLALLATGCGRFKKPSTVVRSVYMDCQNGDFPKARSFFVKDLRDNFDVSSAPDGPRIAVTCDRLTRSSTLDSLEITEETINDNRAIVISDLKFQNGTGQHGERTELLREDGAWKVSH